MSRQLNMLEKSIFCKFRNKFPLLKLFKINNLIYMYDAKSNLLTEVSLEELRVIYDYYVNNCEDKIALYLKDLFLRNICLPGPLIKIVPDKDEINYMIKSQIDEYIPRKLMIEITESCTLRCNYCFYTNQIDTKRKHSERKMDEKIAFKAIDYYYSQYTQSLNQIDSKYWTKIIEEIPPYLSWWGGEPLLNFNLIIKTKNYIESLDWSKYHIDKNKIIYVISTNLTVLNKEILHFLIDNNVNLLISLDGAKEEHNKNRKYKNGKGSFDKVIRNLNTIISSYPNYAKENIVIQPVLADNINPNRALSFLEEYFNLNKSNQKILTILPSLQRNEFEFLPKKSFSNLTNSKMQTEFRSELKSISKLSEIQLDELLRNNKTLYLRLKEILRLENNVCFDNPFGSDYKSLTFSCPLGIDTLFVSINGDIHSCCKVDHSFPIGNINYGLDENSLQKVYYSYYKEIEKNCSKCWIIEFCKICPALVCWGGKFFLPSSIECKQIRKNISQLFIKYIILSTEFEDLYLHLQTYYSQHYENRFDSVPVSLKDFK